MAQSATAIPSPRLIQLNADEGSGDYSGIYRRWRQSSDALGKLQQAKERRDIRDAIKGMDPLWDHPLHVRAFGAYVVSTADHNGLLHRLERTLTTAVRSIFRGIAEALCDGALGRWSKEGGCFGP